MNRSGSGSTRSARAQLTEGPVPTMIVRLTIPMIFGILSMVLYNLVDTFFVGQLGKLQLAALSFTFPVVLVVSSLALGIGIGASAAISRAIGAGNIERVRRLTTDSLVLALLIVGTFATAGILTIEPLFRLLGADDSIQPYITEYMSIWYPGMVFVVIPMVGNNAIRATGDTRTPGIVMMIGALANATFDPLLIFGLGPFPALGIRGAAAATLLGRSITFTVALYVLVRREHLITIRRPRIGAVIQSWKEVLSVGIPAAATRMIVPIGTGVVTRVLAEHGAAAVAGYGVATRVEFFALSITQALAAVMAPFIGQNLGARRIGRIHEGYRVAQIISAVVGGAFFVVLFTLAVPVAGLFTGARDVAAATVRYLRIVPAAYALQGIYLISAPGLNVLRKPLLAAGLGAMEMLGLIVPLALLGSWLFGVPGVFGGIAASYAVTGLASRATFKKVLRSIAPRERSG